MGRESSDQETWTAAEGASPEPGESVNPSQLPEEERGSSGPVQEVPIGRPVSPEDYRALKEQARRGKPQLAPQGQQDPSTRRRRD